MVDRKELQDVFLFLVKRATQRQTSSYKDIANNALLIEGDVTSTIGKRITDILGEIMTWCKMRNHPWLPALVVRESGADTGIPGGGFWAMIGIDPETEYEIKDLAHYVMIQQVYDYYSPMSIQDPAYRSAVEKRLDVAFTNLDPTRIKELHGYVSSALPVSSQEEHVIVSRFGMQVRETIHGTYLLDRKLQELGL